MLSVTLYVCQLKIKSEIYFSRHVTFIRLNKIEINETIDNLTFYRYFYNYDWSDMAAPLK